jgi:hypothetical protein
LHPNLTKPAPTFVGCFFSVYPLPDKIENLSYAIAQWCKQDGHSAQLQAWRHLLSGLLAATVEQLLASHLESLDTPSPVLKKAMLQQAIESGEFFD